MKTRTFKDNILNNLHKDIEDIINKKTESLQEKYLSTWENTINQSIYNDESETLRKTVSTSY